MIRRALAAYGELRHIGKDILARRLGIRMGRLAERLRMSLGEQDPEGRDLIATTTRAHAALFTTG